MPYSYKFGVKITILIAGLYVLSRVAPVFLPIILATVISFVLNPVVCFFCKRKVWPGKIFMPRSIAVLAAFLCVGLLLAVVLAFVLFPFITEFNKFIFDLPSLVLKIQKIGTVIEERANTVQLPDTIRNLVEQALSGAAAYSVDLFRRIITAILNFASQIVELVVVPVLTYYFLKDWPQLKNYVIQPFPLEMRNKVSLIIEEIGMVVSGYIRGQILVSMVIGLMVFSGMYFLGVDYPLVLGLLATLTETIPIVGPIIGSVPAILLAYLVSPELSIKVIIFYLVIHQMENHIIVPNIMGHTVDLHPVAIIISLLIGGHLLGIVGMMLAVPVMAIVRVLVKHLWYYGER